MSTKNLFSDLFFQWAIFLFSYWAGGWGFLLGGAKHKKGHLSKFLQQAVITAHNL